MPFFAIAIPEPGGAAPRYCDGARWPLTMKNGGGTSLTCSTVIASDVVTRQLKLIEAACFVPRRAKKYWLPRIQLEPTLIHVVDPLRLPTTYHRRALLDLGESRRQDEEVLLDQAGIHRVSTETLEALPTPTRELWVAPLETLPPLCRRLEVWVLTHTLGNSPHFNHILAKPAISHVEHEGDECLRSLPENQDRIAQAIALQERGFDYRTIEAQTGVSTAVLHRRVHKKVALDAKVGIPTSLSS